MNNYNKLEQDQKETIANLAGEIANIIATMDEFPHDQIFLSDDGEMNSMQPDYMFLRNKLAITIAEALACVYFKGHDAGFNEGVIK